MKPKIIVHEEPNRPGAVRGVRIILPREVCTTPQETAKVMWDAIQEALEELRANRNDPDEER